MILIGSAVSFIILTAMITVAIVGGKNEAPDTKVPGLEEYGEEIVDFTSENVMVGDGETVFWNVGRPVNSTDIILVTGVQVLISWSDDEQPPLFRPLYSNTPDVFTLSVEGVPAISRGSSSSGNNTTSTGGVIRSSSASEMGSTRVNLNIMDNPIILGTFGNQSNSTDGGWYWEPSGSSEPADTGLFINVSCTAGDIKSSRPALLMYNDPGDQIDMAVTISFKTVPQEVLDHWLQQNSRSTS